MSLPRPGYVLGSLLVLAGLLFIRPALAQDLEPRRWTHMPTGLNVIGLGASYVNGDIFLDPVLEIEDGEVELAGTGFAYLRTFGLLGKSARVDLLVPYASGQWSGLLQGEPASTRRRGFADPRLRLSMLLYGGPAQSPGEFAQSEKSDTVIGAAVSVVFPWGHYLEDRLINLGDNRWMFRPQLGITHMRGKWTYELTGSVFLYGDNDEFWNGKKLERESLYAFQAHVIHTFRPGLWVSLSTAYGSGANVAIDGIPRDAKIENLLVALGLGIPIDRQQGLKFSWMRTETQNKTGADLDSLTVAWSYIFQ